MAEFEFGHAGHMVRMWLYLREQAAGNRRGSYTLGSAPSLLSGKFLPSFTSFLNPTFVDTTRQEMHVGQGPSSKCLE